MYLTSIIVELFVDAYSIGATLINQHSGGSPQDRNDYLKC